MPHSQSIDEEANGSERPSPILECNIRHVRLPSILQLVESEMYTGRIVIDPGGVISIRSGAVVGAVSDGGLTDTSAVRELFLVSEASCRIELDGSVQGQPIGSTIGLTLDGCKLLDEWNELSGERFALAVHPFTMNPELETSLEAVRAVVDAMHDGRTLAAAVEESSLERSVVLPHVMRLIEGGVVELFSGNGHHELAAEEVPPLSADDIEVPDDIDELLVTARTLIKAAELDAAERLLRVALERFPNDRVLAQNMRHLALRRMQQA